MLGMRNVCFELIQINGITITKFNANAYFNNFTGSFDEFNELISSFSETHYNRSGIVESLKSVGNVIISVLNAVLVPFSLIGSLLNIILALLGLPLSSANPIYNLFNGIAGLQIPYIDVG